jgi:hypothetical protein
MKILEGVNLAVRFALELSAIAATAYWGYGTRGGATRWVLAVAAPAVVIAVWALFVSEKPRIDLSRPLQLVIEFVVFGAAALALAAAGRPTLAVVFAVVAAISGTLNFLWD